MFSIFLLKKMIWGGDPVQFAMKLWILLDFQKMYR